MNYYDNQQSPLIQSLSEYAALPIGLGIGGYALKNLWQGSPALQWAGMLGAPYALYKYMQYNNPKNLAQGIATDSKDFYDQVKTDPNSKYVPADVLMGMQNDIKEKQLSKYMQPARSALYDAVPYFALGAAVPSVLSLFKQSRINKQSGENTMTKQAQLLMLAKVARYAKTPGYDPEVLKLACAMTKQAFGWDDISNAASGLGDTLSSGIQGIGNSISSGIGAAGDFMSNTLAPVGNLMSGIMSDMPPVGETVDSVVSKVVNGLNLQSEAVGKDAKEIYDSFLQACREAGMPINEVLQMLKNL